MKLFSKLLVGMLTVAGIIAMSLVGARIVFCLCWLLLNSCF